MFDIHNEQVCQCDIKPQCCQNLFCNGRAYTYTRCGGDQSCSKTLVSPPATGVVYAEYFRCGHTNTDVVHCMFIRFHTLTSRDGKL